MENKSKIKSVLVDSVNAISKKRISIWENSIFLTLIAVSNDERGKWGENFLYNIMTQVDPDVVWLDDKNIKMVDGIYDLKFKGKRVEVKTAVRGTGSINWQHENIYNEKVWDYITFVDVDINGIYFTVMKHEDFKFNEKHPIFNKKPTLRKDQTDKYKFDFSIKSLKSGVDNGLSFYYDVDKDNSSDLIDFIRRMFE